MSDILSSAFALIDVPVEALIAMPFILVGVVLIYATAATLLYYGYNRARERGFRTPGAIALVAIFWMLALALASAISFLVSEDYQIFFWILMLLITPAFTLLIRALPTKRARIFGERRVRVPFTLLGTIVILITVGLDGALLYQWWIGEARLYHLLRFQIIWAALGILGGLYMIRLGRRLKSPQVLPGHNEPVGALYLRSFRQEPQYFVYGDREKYGAYAKNFRASLTPFFGWNIGVRFEEYFRPAVTSSAGPFVALGNPEDYIPREGAFRLYAKDSDWRERLDDLARRASWILVEIGNSDALAWEFDHLRREGLQQKVFIITPPAREVARSAWWFIDFNRYINGMGAVSWLQFCERIAPFGYKMDRTDPGPGAVVTFDDNAKSVVLIRDAKTPEEFVRAMLSRIAPKLEPLVKIAGRLPFDFEHVGHVCTSS
jgi:hypothetical protein